MRTRTASYDYDEISRLWDSPGSEVAGTRLAAHMHSSHTHTHSTGIRPRTISYDFGDERV